ncbi:MAG: hypothetical protein R3D85_09745 [Paracoccaceae bacterium]
MIGRRMRVWRLVAAMAAGLAMPATAWAERVIVRSGEHPDFTRIVLTLPPAASFSLESDGNRAQLAVAGIDAQFDLGEAYRRLAAGRVTRMLPGPEKNVLTIEMSCACILDTFRAETDLLVIDISGPPNTLTETPAVPSAQLASTEPASGLAARRAPASLPSETRYRFPFDADQRRSAMPFALGHDIAGTNDIEPAEPSRPTTGKPAAQTAETATHDRAERLSQAEQRLAEQLSRAVAQGLVTPRAARLPDPVTMPATQHEPQVHDAEPTAEPPSRPATPGINLRAETSADRDFSRLLAACANQYGQHMLHRRRARYLQLGQRRALRCPGRQPARRPSGRIRPPQSCGGA